MTKKKVCMIVYTLYTYDARVRREAETLVSSGCYEITVLCLKEEKKRRSYRKEDVSVIELNMRKYSGHKMFYYIISYIRFLMKSFFTCSILLFKKEIDIVHVHNMPNFLIFAGILPKLLKKTLILDMHDSVPETFSAKYRNKRNFLFKLLCIEEKISSKFSDRIICVNHVQKNVIINRGIPPEKIYISMNVPDHKIFTDLEDRRITRNSNGPFKLVYHGTITKRLGIDVAIEAVAKLKSLYPAIELHLWGKGDFTNYILEKIRENENRDIVYFHGIVSIEELPGTLADMDVGIIPNRKSPATELMLPVKMMEYIALGIPVIAPRLEAIEYYFTDEMVSFFDPENIDSLIKTIITIYENKSLRLSQVIKARDFLKKYGWERQSLDFIKYYSNL
ncbi:MAG: glycosyltransferase family 4 protein [Spirochaetaceae bacterium]|nr:glycosyltransferase family 4 protein [Spirochaetaceae bacterium]